MQISQNLSFLSLLCCILKMSKDKQHPDILWDTRAHDDIEDDTIDRKTLADQINESKGMSFTNEYLQV